MTAPAAAGVRRGPLSRPGVILPIALGLIVLVVLVTPQQSTQERVGRLTTYSASPAGVRGLYEVAGRLGWRTEQRQAPMFNALDTNVVYLVLDPPIGLTRVEMQRLLHAVRHGAGLVYVVGRVPVIDDSLHLAASSGAAAIAALGGFTVADRPARGSCPAKEEGGPVLPMWLDDSVHVYRLVATAPLATRDTVSFLRLTTKGRGEIAALGIPVGRGRVIALSDPDILRNDVIRVCHWGMGVTAVRMLDWVSRGRRPTLVFDEYHQGFQGSQETTLGAVRGFLLRTTIGRIIAQGVLAAIVLLLVYGIRPIAPRGVRRVERRSPLEHVDALARAYAAVGATRIATRRLVRGLERRHGHGAWLAASGGATSTDRFLSAVAARYPGVAQDIARLGRAEEERVSAAELLEVAQAVDRIDRALNGPPVVTPVAVVTSVSESLQPVGTAS